MNNNWNLVGHKWAVDMLKKHVVNAATRHAYLFAGAPGLGRRTLALRFAQALNCQTPAAAESLRRVPRLQADCSHAARRLERNRANDQDPIIPKN